MSSQVELIDLTKDLQTDDIQLAFDQIKARIKPRIKYKIRNGNISIGNRKNANNSQLYIKFYDKHKELLANSFEFYDYYKPIVPENLLRTEITLHAKQIKQYFNTKDLSLRTILECVNNNGDKVINTILREYLNDEQSIQSIQSNSSSETTDKLFNQVNELMKDLILIPVYKRPIDFENRALAILKPGKGNILKVKQWVNDFYFNYMDDEPNFQQFSNRGAKVL